MTKAPPLGLGLIVMFGVLGWSQTWVYLDGELNPGHLHFSMVYAVQAATVVVSRLP